MKYNSWQHFHPPLPISQFLILLFQAFYFLECSICVLAPECNASEMTTSYSLQVPPCLISNVFWLFTPTVAPDRAQRRAGNSAHSPSLTPQALPLSLAPSLPLTLPLSFPGHGKMPRSKHGWKTGEKRKVDGENKRRPQMWGTFSKIKCWKIVYSTFSRGGWRGGWWRLDLESAAGGLGTLLSH